MTTDPKDHKIEELEAELRQQRRLVQGLQQQIARILDQLAKADGKDKKDKKRREKGDKKAKLAPTQEEAPQAPERKQPDDTKIKGIPRKQPPAAHLPRSPEHHAAHPGPCCHAPALSQGPDKVIEQRDFHPARVEVRQMRLEQWNCDNCGTTHNAPLPAMALPKGSMTGSLLAWIAYNKCAMHMPLIRTCEYLATLGLDLSSSTVCNAMGHVARLVEPVYDRITARLLASMKILLDGTGMKVLQPGESGTHRGQFAVYCNDELTVFGYSASKHGHYFTEFLRFGQHDEYRGLLVTDAASNMDLLEAREGITRCGCWQHARDNYKNARISAPVMAEEAIAWIGTFFDVEHEADSAGDTAEERLARRKRDTRPLMDGFRRWMSATQPKLDPDEDLYKAIQYCINHQAELEQCMTDGRVPLTNNLAERELGVIGRGRRGFLFAGSDASGHQLAKIYTIVRTCQRMAIAPFEYLAWVLPQLSDLPVNRRKGHLDTLTPWGYRKLMSTV